MEYYFGFWATVCQTVRPMLSDRCLFLTLSVCNVGVLRPNGRKSNALSVALPRHLSNLEG